ncbi:hypothetical protein [Streptomyces sp. NBC_00273]|uniref:hypothetical protein n=1 Tax=Streptomyces sp. NBC_00273 TaxID=2903644 RepID=UPI002E2ACA4B|nr:hypothetical protein [Streptomyces sp. NBC_00273]
MERWDHQGVTRRQRTYENAVGNAAQPLLERIKQAQRGDRPTARLTTLSLT